MWSYRNVGVCANGSKEQNRLHQGKKEGVCKKGQAEFNGSALYIKVLVILHCDSDHSDGGTGGPTTEPT